MGAHTEVSWRKWETDFAKAEPSRPMKPLAEMTKDEYLSYVQEVKEEKEVISKGLTRVKNKYKVKVDSVFM